jgi:hypothetical protein
VSRTAVTIVGALALALAALATTHKVVGWYTEATAARDCLAAVSLGAKAAADPAKACPAAIAADHLVAVQARACDEALDARPENAFGVGARCTAPVKRIWAERNVARDEAARLSDTLNQERLGRDAAIDRAAASATLQAERKARAAAAVQAAPRDAAGLVVCGAQCLRDRAAFVAGQ